MQIKHEAKRKKASHDRLAFLEYWHSIGDSNPCYRRERAVS